MNPKKLIQAIRNPELDLQERMFRLLTMIGLAGLAIGMTVAVLSGEPVSGRIPMMVVFVVLACIVGCSIRSHKIQTGAVTTAVLVLFVLLPYEFLSSSGAYGGSPIWLLFGVVYVCLVVRGKVRYVLLGCSFAVFSACYYVSYTHTDELLQHSHDMVYTDSYCALLIVGALICSMILFQNSIYLSENAVAQRQKKEIEELNKAQNRFFSSMSHEIRTPINTIIGLNEMILREEVSDEVAADAKNIQSASNMLLTLINDILDISKIESGKMDIVPIIYDTGAMLSDLVNMIWVRAKSKGLDFHIDVDQSLPSQLFGDEVRIKQVLINVLNNAVKYTSEGSVTLSIEYRRTNDGRAEVSYSVTDTGMGIKKENIPQLFSAFKRVDEQKNRYIEGTGLGLSIVKQLVDLMDGTVSVNSVYTKGSTFVITLPQEIVNASAIGELNLEARHAVNAREHYKQSFEAPGAHVLIVDDNESNLMVAEKLLRGTKVQIDTVTSGAECLKRTFEKHYDVIFMDHLMPEMDGIECLHALRTQAGGLNLETAVVALTANAGGENQALYRREGFDGYLLKPVSGKQIEAELLRQLPKELVRATSGANTADADNAPVLSHRRRLSIMITTDSVCDLPQNILERHKITVMPYRVVTEGGEFWDGIEAETDGVLSYISDYGRDAHSEPPRVSDYEKFFADNLTKAQYIIHIAMAQKVSRGYANALEASRSFDNVRVIDSGHLSSGMGLMVQRAAECAESNWMSPDAITDEMERIKEYVRTSFITGSTEYLMRAGRLSPKVNTLCGAFLLHPVLVLKKSRMTLGGVKIGTKDSVQKGYIAETLKDERNIDRRTLFITYAGMTRGELDEIAEQVRKTVVFENVIYQKASPAISANCGPGSFGLLFMMRC